MATINLTGSDALLTFPAGVIATDYSKGILSGYSNVGNFKSSWTGSAFQYITGYTFPDSGTIFAYTASTQGGANKIEIKNVNYIIQSTDKFSFDYSILLGDDTWFGSSGSDVFVWGKGNDIFYGGGGLDTLDFSLVSGNKKSLFGIINNSNNAFTITVGTKITKINDISRLKFSDVSIALDINGNAGIALKVVGAVLGKNSISDKSIMGIAINLIDSGVSELDLLGMALTYKLGANYSAQQEINLLYLNVFNLTPSTSTNAIYLNLLNKGFVTNSQLAFAAAETIENNNNINLTGLVKSGIEFIPIS